MICVEIPANDRDQGQDQAGDDEHGTEDQPVEHDRRADGQEERPRAGSGHVHAGRRLRGLGLFDDYLGRSPERARSQPGQPCAPPVPAPQPRSLRRGERHGVGRLRMFCCAPFAHRVPQPAADGDQRHDQAQHQQLRLNGAVALPDASLGGSAKAKSSSAAPIGATNGQRDGPGRWTPGGGEPRRGLGTRDRLRATGLAPTLIDEAKRGTGSRSRPAPTAEGAIRSGQLGRSSCCRSLEKLVDQVAHRSVSRLVRSIRALQLARSAQQDGEAERHRDAQDDQASSRRPGRCSSVVALHDQ